MELAHNDEWIEKEEGDGGCRERRWVKLEEVVVLSCYLAGGDLLFLARCWVLARSILSLSLLLRMERRCTAAVLSTHTQPCCTTSDHLCLRDDIP